MDIKQIIENAYNQGMSNQRLGLWISGEDYVKSLDFGEKEISRLIQQHKTAKQEAFELLSELNKIETHSLSPEQEKDLTEAIIKLEVEYEMRSVFVNELEDLI